jgi:hypothetical protein
MIIELAVNSNGLLLVATLSDAPDNASACCVAVFQKGCTYKVMSALQPDLACDCT